MRLPHRSSGRVSSKQGSRRVNTHNKRGSQQAFSDSISHEWADLDAGKEEVICEAGPNDRTHGTPYHSFPQAARWRLTLLCDRHNQSTASCLDVTPNAAGSDAIATKCLEQSEHWKKCSTKPLRPIRPQKHAFRSPWAPFALGAFAREAAFYACNAAN